MMSRRRLLASAGSGLLLAGCEPGKRYLPPTFEGIFGLADALTMSTQRLLLTNQSMAREFGREMISANFPAINTVDPEDPTYRRHRASNFATWRLPVTGLVSRPHAFTLAELRAMPSRTQITQHSCERGWSAIGEWTGVQLAYVLQAAGIMPQARYVVFRTVDDWWDSLDLFDALHPQTLLAYGMNGGVLPIRHGAPIRLRVERHLGYKNLKFIKSLQVTDRLAGIETGKGSGAAGDGYPWYAAI